MYPTVWHGLQRLYLKGHIFGITKTIRPKTTVIEGRIVNQRDTYCIRGILTRERNVSLYRRWLCGMHHLKLQKRGDRNTRV
jgi:hypothetical protein